MSQYFNLGNEALWNPSNGASGLFLRQVAVFEAELGLSSGFGPMENDDCQIDPVVFEIFTHALLAQHRRTSHTIVLALSEGFVATVLALAERAGLAVDLSSHAATPDGPLKDVQVSVRAGMSSPAEGKAWKSGLRARAQELRRSMAR
ncbi:DUF6086 family protein [Streptomyces sp. NPDC057136]|uniref:DUF6086 family protein n=1 Tax=Streptomyces sp. NPDC057136 TaxID=3346029 RepID=UPI003639900F